MRCSLHLVGGTVTGNADKLDADARDPKHCAMPGKRRRFTEAQINHGNQSAAAKALEEATGVPVSRQSIFERVKTSARLRQVILEVEEQNSTSPRTRC